MKKNSTRLILLLLVLALFPLCAQAKNSVVTDNADLISSSEEAALTQRINEIYEQHHFQPVILTVNSTGSKSVRMYAADYYDDNGFGYGSSHDGLIFIISMADRSYYTVTTGSGIRIFTDYGIKAIGEDIVFFLSDGDYYAAFDRYLTDVEKYLVQAKNGAPYDVDNTVQLSSPLERAMAVLPILFIVALIITVIVIVTMIFRMKTSRRRNEAFDYLTNQNICRRSDIYLYTTETRRRIETSSNSGGGGHSGGSSTFHGSSGTSHGGGGGHF